MSWLCNIFGYLLNFIYSFVKNYGLALIIFSIIVKIIMLPISIKQQKTLKKSGKIQGELKELQDKYSKDQEKLAQETMDLYKRENMSPFSGCLSSILQIVLLIAMFMIVRQPLTYMLKLDPAQIENYTQYVDKDSAYSEIEMIKEARTNEAIDVDINMDFLGIDLSNVLMKNWQDWTAYILPVLYVLTSIISLRMNSNLTANKDKDKEKNKEKDSKKEEGEDKDKKDDDTVDMATEMTKNMNLFMPIMSVSIAIVVPQGLALYWLMNNVLMIIERIVINKVSKEPEEE